MKPVLDIKPPVAGETWYEQDPRYAIERLAITVLSVLPSLGSAEIERVSTKRRTVVKLARFNGKRGGYGRTPYKP